MIRDRHLEFFVKLAEESEPKIFSGEAGTWLRRIEKEVDNLRAATEWSTHSGKAVAALRMAGALVYFMFLHGPLLSEWQDRMQHALAQPEGMERTLARAKALNAMGFLYWADIYPTSRRAELEEALSIGRELGDQWNIGTALRNLGLLASMLGNFGEARSFLEASLEVWQKLGAQGATGMSWTLMFLADTALNQNEPEQARSVYEQANVILRELGDINFLAYSVRRLSLIAWRKNDFAAAAPLCKESLTLNQQSGDRRGVIASVAGFAAIAAGERRLERATKLLASVETQLASIGIRLLPVDQAEYERNLAFVRAQLNASKLAAAWSQGNKMTLEQAITLALDGD
jgi:tetratricopeptide (TPR) repeat protein